jgi:hypothetical protein
MVWRGGVAWIWRFMRFAMHRMLGRSRGGASDVEARDPELISLFMDFLRRLRPALLPSARRGRGELAGDRTGRARPSRRRLGGGRSTLVGRHADGFGAMASPDSVSSGA